MQDVLDVKKCLIIIKHKKDLNALHALTDIYLQRRQKDVSLRQHALPDPE